MLWIGILKSLSINALLNLWGKILVGCIPAAIIGLLFDEVFDNNYNVINKIKMLKQDNKYIAYTRYIKPDIVNYTFDKKRHRYMYRKF